jgi:TetR/AcrR family transcriptional repressor of nem operon
MPDMASTKNRLLKAARQIADGEPARLDAAAVAATAQLPPSAIAAAYADFELLLCDVLGQMYDEIRDNVTKLTLNMPAGPGRLKLALDTYLQGLLERPALAVLARRLRFHPQGAQVIRQRVTGFNLMFQLELKASDWPHAAQTARLCTAALIETALAESEAGQRLPEMRDSLFGYFDTPLAA